MKHALLSTPYSSALFSEDVILTSLTQVEESLFTQGRGEGEGGTASASSSSGYRRQDSSSSSSRGCGSRSFRALSVLLRLLRPDVLRLFLRAFSILLF